MGPSSSNGRSLSSENRRRDTEHTESRSSFVQPRRLGADSLDKGAPIQIKSIESSYFSSGGDSSEFSLPSERQRTTGVNDPREHIYAQVYDIPE